MIFIDLSSVFGLEWIDLIRIVDQVGLLIFLFYVQDVRYVEIAGA